jgi:putative FmdB family regulatory protein
MPFYEYKCLDCGGRVEMRQSYDEMVAVRDSLRCQKCEGRMQFVFPAPNLSTDTTFVRNWGDGFADRESMQRNRTKAAAKAAGLNPVGHTYCPGLCAPGTPKDPKAWVPHDNARGYIKKRCEELNYSCEEFGIESRQPETDPLEGPYTVAPDIVNREVERIVETEHEGHIAPEKLPDLVEATTERLSGNQD